ncbi:uncharacterized protein METZ01_LOCUS156113 [marine metagenome]|uniref:Uncharacterized protein n=1 Tax=marine metagenome TaxID=408172 RepID=A0A382APC5_9ZZZZ
MARSLSVACLQTGPKAGVLAALEEAFAFGIVAVVRGADWLTRPE